MRAKKMTREDFVIKKTRAESFTKVYFVTKYSRVAKNIKRITQKKIGKFYKVNF